MFSDYLKLRKVNVVGVGYNGKDAVELFVKHRPDIVFLDHRMPEYDGTFALFNIRKKDENAKVIIITADNSLDMNPKIHELKPTAIIHKPFNINVVMETVEKIMEGQLAASNGEKNV